MIWHSGGSILWNGANLEIWQCEFLSDLWNDEMRAAIKVGDLDVAQNILEKRLQLNKALQSAINWRRCA